MAGAAATPELAGFARRPTGNSYVLGNPGGRARPRDDDDGNSNETGDFLAKLDRPEP